ncbi:MAG: hypothetical protein AAGH64_01055 [Planctomycetota bacterium]
MRNALKLLVLLALPLASCAHQHPPDPDVRDAGAHSLTAAKAYPAIADALDRGTPLTQRFRIVSGDDSGATGTRSVSVDGDGRAVVGWTVEGEDGPRQENHVVRDAAGDLRVERMPNRERGVVTRFEPAFLHFPSVLEVDTPVQQTLEMLVADFDTPGRIKQTGDAVSTLTLLGGADVLVDGAPRVALVVRAELESAFGPARVVRVADRWFLQELGFVGERFDETVRIFGLRSEQRTREIWLEGVEPVRAGGADQPG